MDQHYGVMDLKDELIDEIKQLENKISSETGNPCILIAYEDQTQTN